MNSELYESRGDIDFSQRAKIAKGGAVVWFTGLSGSGKSTVSRLVEKMLYDDGILSYRLDGDNIRMGINSDLGFSPSDREENIRRIAEIAALFEDAGLVCLVSLISPFEHSRKEAEKRAKNFITVYVKASVEECARRDVKGLYKKALEGKIPEFTGISSPYEEPLCPDITLDTASASSEECALTVYRYIIERLSGRN